MGETVTVFDSRDPTKKGRKGEVVMETAKTLLLQTSTGRITVEKLGAVLVVAATGDVLSGDDLYGRLQDRFGERKR
ncbi:MAG: ribonuclease P protein subunit [Nitrososphaerales archaeon]|nr:ribonuclease P protein subunit [Nitrososphaerales archaeon]